MQADAYAVRGMVRSSQWTRTRVGDGNRRATEDFEKALAINPNHSMANVWYSTLLENENRVDEAISRLRLAIDLDPRNRIPYVNLPGLLALQGQTDEAISMLLYTINVFPNWSLPNDYLTLHLQGLGRIDEAVAWSIRLRELSDDPLAGANSLGLYRLLGYEEQIDAFIEAIPRDHAVVPVGRAYERFIRGDYETAMNHLEALVDTEYASAEYFYPMLARAALLAGETEAARRWLLLGSPRLTSDASETVDRFNAGEAALLGYLESELGNARRAGELFDGALAATRTIPRIGFIGYGILDVRVLAQKGRTRDALDAFEEAVERGFVSNVYFDMLEIDEDPLLDPLRDEPRFEAALDRMRNNLSVMAQNVDAAVASGDWAALREQTRSRSTLVSERL